METKEINDDTPIYRYLSFERFVQLVYCGLFVPPAHFFEDKMDGRIPFNFELVKKTLHCDLRHVEYLAQPYRNLFEIFGFLRFLVNDRKTTLGAYTPDTFLTDEQLWRYADEIKKEKTEKERCKKVEGILTELYVRCVQDSAHSDLVSCWSLQREEEPRMWSEYARNGVRIKTTVKKVKEILIRSGDFSIDGNAPKQVEYIPIEKYHEAFENVEAGASYTIPKDWMFRKRDIFQFEQELRFVVRSKIEAREDSFLAHRDGAYFEVKNDDIEEILFSPYLDRPARLALEKLAKMKFRKATPSAFTDYVKSRVKSSVKSNADSSRISWYPDISQSEK